MQDDAKPSALTELADLWEAQSASAEPAARRETLRECADALHMLLSLRTNPIDTTLQPERSPTHRCKVCGAFWMEWSTNWSLCSKECGPCCDNQAMGDQIEPLIISDLYVRRTTAPAQPADVERVARSIMRWNRDYGRDEFPADATPSDYEMAMARAALAAMPVGGDPDAATGCADDFLPGNADDWRASLTPPADADAKKFALGDRVTKTKGSSWTGRVVGFYSTSLTPVGYAVESENEPGSVQIYPESALAALGQGGVRS